MKKLIVAALLISSSVQANGFLYEKSQFIDLKLGTTQLEDTGPSLDAKSFAVSATKMYFTLSDKNDVYLGLTGSLEIHGGSDTKIGYDGYGYESVKQEYMMYSANIGPALYWSPDERFLIYSALGVSYSKSEVDITVKLDDRDDSLKISGDKTGTGFTWSAGAKYSVTDEFNMGIQYQKSSVSLAKDVDVSTIYVTAGMTF